MLDPSEDVEVRGCRPGDEEAILAFQREGFLVERTKWILVGRNYVGGEDAAWFRRNGFYTPGDFDLS